MSQNDSLSYNTLPADGKFSKTLALADSKPPVEIKLLSSVSKPERKTNQIVATSDYYHVIPGDFLKISADASPEEVVAAAKLIENTNIVITGVPYDTVRKSIDSYKYARNFTTVNQKFSKNDFIVKFQVTKTSQQLIYNVYCNVKCLNNITKSSFINFQQQKLNPSASSINTVSIPYFWHVM